MRREGKKSYTKLPERKKEKRFPKKQNKKI